MGRFYRSNGGQKSRTQNPNQTTDARPWVYNGWEVSQAQVPNLTTENQGEQPMWNFVGPKYRWYDDHIFFINENGNRELRGRWFLGVAALVYFGGQYYVFHLMR